MNRSVGWAFALVTTIVYLVLGFPGLFLMPLHSGFEWIALAILHEFIALALALELAENLFGLLLPHRNHPCLDNVDRTKIKLAALYVCCDDLDAQALCALQALKDVDVYILDDSQTLDTRLQVDESGLTIVRRSDRHGYKAGNLNHWLLLYADRYKYFVILDSDSILSSEAIWKLVAYAEHPSNRDVAIVQSTIQGRPGNYFQNILGRLLIPRWQILSRLHDRIGWTLSHGHNNLHRTNAIVGLGGFDLVATCEDTLMSLQLTRRGWRIILVPTLTYDANPSNVFAYRRRYVRWARQTIDLVLALKGLPRLSYALLMARHLFAYLLPNACILLLALSAILCRATPNEAWHAIGRSFTLSPGYEWVGITWYLLWAAWVSVLILRIALWYRTHAGFRSFVIGTLLEGSLMSFCSLHSVVGMFRSFIGERVGFFPTGAYQSRIVTLRMIWKAMVFPWLIYSVISIYLFFYSRVLLLGLPAFWSTILLASPIILSLYHTDQIKRSSLCY